MTYIPPYTLEQLTNIRRAAKRGLHVALDLDPRLVDSFQHIDNLATEAAMGNDVTGLDSSDKNSPL